MKDTTVISQICSESDEPIYITKNGYSDMVIMSMKAYEEKCSWPRSIPNWQRWKPKSRKEKCLTSERGRRRYGQSMGYELVKTDAFERDLDATIRYIALSLENRVVAASLLDEVEKSYDDLERMPLMHETCHDPNLKELGYRRAGTCNYVMAYKVNEEIKMVTLMRFFHGRQDYEKLI